MIPKIDPENVLRRPSLLSRERMMKRAIMGRTHLELDVPGTASFLYKEGDKGATVTDNIGNKKHLSLQDVREMAEWTERVIEFMERQQ